MVYWSYKESAFSKTEKDKKVAKLKKQGYKCRVTKSKPHNKVSRWHYAIWVRK